MITDAEYRLMQARLSAALGPGQPSHSPRAELEYELQSDIETECRRRGWIPFRSRMDRATTMPIGFPDFVIMADAGRVIWVEAKTKSGKVKPEQAALHAAARQLGHEVLIVRSISDFIYAINNRPA